LTDAVKMAAEVPAKIMGINKGRLEAGYDADVIVFDEGIHVNAAFVSGNQAV
ncbi:MAG: N-acetylglucosamine-6-phosphate deacetylase, partial [Ruminococcaceae bacterium]|nr:N-acetylglucosamine-6-phosphate deacetylase [Oscillospiraceae bacterium]